MARLKLVLDLGAIAHQVRRWWWAKFGLQVLGRCATCGKALSVTELRHYGHSCEACEAIDFARLERIEREHFGDFERQTGVYASPAKYCTYPSCTCPFDAPADPNWCARGLPKQPKDPAADFLDSVRRAAHVAVDERAKHTKGSSA
jgi:hypothetical protein